MPEKNTMDLFSLSDRVALITGGSKGIGKEMALGLAEAGATTLICSRHLDDCVAVAKEIADRSGRESIGLSADVTAEAEVEALFGSITDRYGRLDALINSAGINVRHPIEEFSPEEFRQVIDVNLTGTWLCCRAAGSVMRKQGGGSVVNISSVLGTVGLEERTAYCASKSAVIGMTKTLALEWASSGIRCNALCPGPFLTEINVPLLKTPEKVASLLANTAFNRWGELHEIRGAAVFLASDASSFMTGASLIIDGGWTAR